MTLEPLFALALGAAVVALMLLIVLIAARDSTHGGVQA
jgi:hypothetical protein